MKKNEKKFNELQSSLQIQIANNRVLRDYFRKEQQTNKELVEEITKLNEKIEKLKQNVRLLALKETDIVEFRQKLKEELGEENGLQEIK